MQTSRCFAGAAALFVSLGCQSDRYSTSVARNPLAAQQPAYTVEIIPNPRLTPTSREGDSAPIYSSNIIAVYANKPGGTNGVSRDSGGQRNK